MAQWEKKLPAVQETWFLSLGWEDPLGGGLGNPFQASRPKNPLDRGAWWATVHRVAKRGEPLNVRTHSLR